MSKRIDTREQITVKLIPTMLEKKFVKDWCEAHEVSVNMFVHIALNKCMKDIDSGKMRLGEYGLSIEDCL